MTTSMPSTTDSGVISTIRSLSRVAARIPGDAIALLARFSIAAVFWKSGQTKVEGFAVDLIDGRFDFGWPHVSDLAVELFREEYRVPLLAPQLAATAAAFAEHLFPLMLLFGFGTRLASLGLLGMTLVIQLFVYPDAYPTHGTWGALLLYLLALGPGRASVDAWLQRRYASR